MSSLFPGLDPKCLAQLVPLNSLSTDNFNELLQRIHLECLPAGRALFKCGESDRFAYYLLRGEAELRRPNQPPLLLQADMPLTRHPLAPRQPRDASLYARSDIAYVRIDTDLLDMLLTWDQSASYLVADLQAEQAAEQADWMTRMLSSQIFQQIPPANLQEIFRRMETLPAVAGEVILRQGEAGDYYYILRQGRAGVTRRAPSGTQVRLAELRSGQGFGEEALLADSNRNATVTMLSDGKLMRLSKQDFDLLLKAPVLHEIDYAQACLAVQQGARWLDVRLESEHLHRAIPDSLNIPLNLLRLRRRELAQDCIYIVYCDTGRRSAAAAYVLSEAGFQVRLLAGGCAAVLPTVTA